MEGVKLIEKEPPSLIRGTVGLFLKAYFYCTSSVNQKNLIFTVIRYTNTIVISLNLVLDAMRVHFRTKKQSKVVQEKNLQKDLLHMQSQE